MTAPFDVDAPKIELIQGEIAAVTLKPGDRLVIMFPQTIMPIYAERIAELVRHWAPDVPVMVIGDGGRLGVIRSEDE